MAEENTGGQEQTTRVLAVARSRKRLSKVWEHFNGFTTANGEDKAKCKRCHAELVADTRDHGTNHLWRHFRSCSEQAGTRGEHPKSPPPPQPSRAASEADHKGACEDLARMIAVHGYGSSIVEDDYFRSFVIRLNPDFQLPSRRAIEEMCDGVSDEAEMDSISKMERTSGNVSLAVGTAPAVDGTVVYVACHFIDDEWTLHKMIKDVYMVVPRNHGPMLGSHQISFEESSNGGLVPDDLMDSIIYYSSIRNKLFSMAWGKPWKDDIDRTSIDQIILYTTYMDDVLHSISKCLKDNVYSEFRINSFYDQDFIGLTRRERELEEIISYLGLDELRTNNKEWYSLYCSLEVVHKGRSSTAAEDATRTGQQSSEETAFTELLRKFFGAIYRSIQTISAPNSPTSNLCLRELFKVRDFLQSELEGASGDKAHVYEESNYFKDKVVADVLREAKNILDSGIKESYLLWSIPLVLDPRYKLRYIKFNFDRAFGSEAENYISEVTSEIEGLFTDYSEGDRATSDGHSDHFIEMAVDNSDPLDQAWKHHCRQQQVLKELERCLPDMKELDRYLEDDLVSGKDDVFDILNWWKVNSWKYPTVARMARDALAMPACSKPTAEQISRMRSMVRGYSKQPFRG